MILSVYSHDVRATITYRMAPSPIPPGPASIGPIIGSGQLRVQSAGGTFVLPLSALGIDTQHWSIFPESPTQGCGTGAPLSIERGDHGRDYVIVETIAVGKGCAAMAHVVDVATRRAVPVYAADHPSEHVSDVPQSLFSGAKHMRVTDIEHFSIPFSVPSKSWTITAIAGGDQEIFASDLAASETPHQDETIALGVIHDSTFTEPLLVDDRVFRLSRPHEQAWQARQTPMPISLQRTLRYNMYFSYSDRLASEGHFKQALSAYREALSYLDDARLRDGEAADIPRLTAIVQAVQNRRMTTAQAKQAWFKP